MPTIIICNLFWLQMHRVTHIGFRIIMSICNLDEQYVLDRGRFERLNQKLLIRCSRSKTLTYTLKSKRCIKNRTACVHLGPPSRRATSIVVVQKTPDFYECFFFKKRQIFGCCLPNATKDSRYDIIVTGHTPPCRYSHMHTRFGAEAGIITSVGGVT